MNSLWTALTHSVTSHSLQPNSRLATTSEFSRQVSNRMIDSVSSNIGKHGTLIHGISSIHGDSSARSRTSSIHGESSARRSVTTDPPLANLCVKTDLRCCLHVNARRQKMIDRMSVKLALKRKQEAIEDKDCRIESMSIADNTPIGEFVMDSIGDVCSAMSN